MIVYSRNMAKCCVLQVSNVERILTGRGPTFFCYRLICLHQTETTTSIIFPTCLRLFELRLPKVAPFYEISLPFVAQYRWQDDILVRRKLPLIHMAVTIDKHNRNRENSSVSPRCTILHLNIRSHGEPQLNPSSSWCSGGQISTKHLTTSIRPFFASCRLPQYPEFWRCVEPGILFLGPHCKRSLKSLDTLLKVPMRNTQLLPRPRKMVPVVLNIFFLGVYMFFIWGISPPPSLLTVENEGIL